MSPTTLLSPTTPELASGLAPANARGPAVRTMAGALGCLVLWALLGFVLEPGLPGIVALGAPVLVLFHTVVRRRPLAALWARDSATFRRPWARWLLVPASLLVLPVAMTWQSFRTGHWADNSWTILLMIAVLAVGYAVARSLLATVLAAAIAVLVASWVLAPNLATTRNGDPQLLSDLKAQQDMGLLAGYHDLAVARIDLDASNPVSLAGLGAGSTTPMEVGSMTKAMTGLVIADAVRRGEVQMDVPVSTYLPALADSPAGAVTMQELVTHHAGYADFGVATLQHGAWAAPLGRNFLTTGSAQMTKEIRAGDLSTRATYVYSSLGAATAGQAAAAAAGLSYSELMRTRLFEPLGMTHTAIESKRALVQGGESATGLPEQPWVFGAYAPAGAAVSTTADLAKLATALLNGTAPGMTALTPTASADQSNTRVGAFWHTSTWQTGQTITWHNGQTGGYASYLGLDRENHRAVIVLSDVAKAETSDLGIELLADR